VAKFSIGAAALAATAFVFSVAIALPAMNQTPQQTLQSMVGTWNCTNSGGGMPASTERDTDTMYGSWLRTAASYSGYTGVGYLGYDSKAHRWVYVNADEHGGYGIGSSNSANLNGSSWRDAYPADGGTGTFRIVSANEYTFTGMFPNGHGKMVASHSVCKRAS
jgi:hypothetical protein